MLDHARELREPIPVDATRVGRTDLGAGSVLLDDDMLTVLIPHSSCDRYDGRPLRLRFVALDVVALDGAELTLVLRDGTRLTLVSPAAAELRRELLDRCQVLPELMRTLRAFGSQRMRRGTRTTASHDQQRQQRQQRFFAPLLAARQHAGAAPTPAATIAAFDAASLRAAIEGTLSELAAERCAEAGPARRALEAELEEVIEPLVAAIEQLRTVATAAADAPDDLRRWRTWAMQLRVTFEAADRAWLALDDALDAAVIQ